jgi:hypothetical protein
LADHFAGRPGIESYLAQRFPSWQDHGLGSDILENTRIGRVRRWHEAVMEEVVNSLDEIDES